MYEGLQAHPYPDSTSLLSLTVTIITITKFVSLPTSFVLAPSVFTRLLGPDFAEGSAPIQDGSTRWVSLQDEDPDAIIWVCQALHRHENVMENISL